ncbi:MAG: double-strand break repair helicase AddA, partial [Alphaproteobacteria bacterium]|nr:double-strand break repair helicase AddA [Alphaproteobacteria bacterium]
MTGDPSPPGLAEAPARAVDPNGPQRAAADPAWSVWVSASAGTGKTRVLTSRVLRLLLAGTPPARILCLTFTKAAAAEMANRISRVLAGWAIVPADRLAADLADLTGAPADPVHEVRARRLFAEVLEAPGGLPIMTIHAFSQSLLRRFPLEAGLPPHFTVMEARKAADLALAARDRLITAPEPPVAEALGKVAGRVGEEALSSLLHALMADRARLERVLSDHGGPAGAGRALRAQLGLEPGETEAAVLAGACEDGAFDGPALRAAATALCTGGKTDGPRGEALAAWLAAPAERAATFDSYARVFLTKDGDILKRLATKPVVAACPPILQTLGVEAERMLRVMERRRAVIVAEATEALLTLGAAFARLYEEAKALRGLLDFDDLILRAGDLIGRDGMVPWVQYKLDGGIDHLLIDEAQDTSPAQWRLIAALTEEFFATNGPRLMPRTVFAVGDVKQSIYSFQRADPAEFVRMRGHYAAQARAAGRDWRPARLDVSFRSTRAVLDFVDTVFAAGEARDGVIFEGDGPLRHETVRAGEAGAVALWPLIEPQGDEEGEAWAPPVAQGRAVEPSADLAQRLARTIAGWTGHGVGEGLWLEARGRPAAPGDILILVRTRNRLFGEIVRALKERNVPVSGVDRMVVPDQLAVMDLMAVARFLLLPEDDLTLATVLKTPFIGLGEEQLFAVAHARGGGLWPALKERAAGDARLEAAVAWLSDWLGRVDYLTPFALIAGLLDTPCPADPVSGRRAMLARLGGEAEDPLEELLTLALGFEATEAPSLQHFVHWLEQGRTEVKRELEAGPQSRVRIMTVHGAKGLQAPIVILPDTTAVPKKGPAILWPEAPDGLPLWAPRRAHEESRCRELRAAADHRRDQEYRRLLYVALTRAEDRLLVCGYRGTQEPAGHCWYALCRAAMDGLPGVTTTAAGSLHYRVAQETAAPAAAAPAAALELPDLPEGLRRPPPPEP